MEHPGKILAEYLENNGYSQKDFSIKIKKRVSEINELIRGKRNITIAWDLILSEALGTPQKFWVQKQLDYDYDQMLKKESEKNAKIFQEPQDINENQDVNEYIIGKKYENPFKEEDDIELEKEEKEPEKFTNNMSKNSIMGEVFNSF